MIAQNEWSLHDSNVASRHLHWMGDGWGGLSQAFLTFTQRHGKKIAVTNLLYIIYSALYINETRNSMKQEI